MSEQVTIFDHPLITHKISILRDERTGSKQFRELIEEIAMLMGYEALRDLPTEYVEIKTPITTTKAKMIAGKKLAIVPILRAGLGMVSGILSLVPSAKVGHVGLYRDEVTLEPHEYYCKLPEDIANRLVIILDPMLATADPVRPHSTSSSKRAAKTSSSCPSSPRPKALPASPRIIRMCISIAAAWMKSSTKTVTSFRVSATQATVFSVQNNFICLFKQ